MDERINLLARVARTSHSVGEAAQISGQRSILTLAAASFGARPVDENTVPTGFDLSAAALFESIVEGAYLVATADGVFDDEERTTFERIVTASCGGVVSRNLVADLVSDLADQLEEDGLLVRIERLALGVHRAEQGLELLRIAALMAHVSDDVSAVERDVLVKLATACRLDVTTVDRALDDVKASIAGVA